MTASPSIEIESLSKRYTLGAQVRGRQMREQLIQWLSNPFARKKGQEIWALRDVTFAVPQGQVVGIIGRNGAGKSTLLKILSRITYPTSGSMRVRGRVGSLLEVGTGFHEELTGRENIYLNGSILGMRRRQIDKHFDAIVEFSGVAAFIDTPIKRFSSGMRLRLGFAVAAHLDPDVLIVDEVLAVGDAAFQRKCMTAMEGLRSGGRTVLFVSHNMAAVENLCSRALWIDGGRLRMDGDATDVIRAYLASYTADDSNGQELQTAARRGSGELRFTRVELLGANGTPCRILQSGDTVTLRMHFRAERPVRHPNFGVQLFTDMGTLVTETSTDLYGLTVPSIAPGEGFIELSIQTLNLMPGRYAMMLSASSPMEGKTFDADVRAVVDVEASAAYGTTRALSSRFGIVYFRQRWNADGCNPVGSARDAGALTG
jgi:lipopolysaccharide transport system ATP-binding protein